MIGWIRMAMAIGKVAHTQKPVVFKDWPATKPTTPWLSLPVLHLADGTELGQSRAILRFVGKCLDLYPTDPVMATHVDTICDVADDLFVMILREGNGLEKAAKEAAANDCGAPPRAWLHGFKEVTAGTREEANCHLCVVGLME